MKCVSQKLWPGAGTDGEVNGVLADISFCCDEAQNCLKQQAQKISQNLAAPPLMHLGLDWATLTINKAGDNIHW